MAKIVKFADMKRISKLLLSFTVMLPLISCTKVESIHIVTTGDVHGHWFSRSFDGTREPKSSLMSVKAYVDSLRNANGKGSVILLDAGDFLQGDNASFFANFNDDAPEHLFPRMAAYMGYDVCVVGNHDIETGHDVYDKVNAELHAAGIPWLAANAIRKDSGEAYFTEYTVLKKNGVKVAVIGFTNPNIKAWLTEDRWSGMDFKSIIDMAQHLVDRVREKENPDVVLMVVHSGSGKGDGSSYEDQGLDLLASVKGVDLIVTSHDHTPLVADNGGTWLVNAGKHAMNVGHAVVNVKKKGGKLIEKEVVKAEVVPMDKEVVDEKMVERFKADYEKIEAFSEGLVGRIDMDLSTGESYSGPSLFMNFLHTVQLSGSGAEISMAAPLTFNGVVKNGDVRFNDMFTIYPYENSLNVVSLSGREIKDYLEFSYGLWINYTGKHILNIGKVMNTVTGEEAWAFLSRYYNLDSAAGLIYEVDITKPQGSRVNIVSMADGEAFDYDRKYNVAMTSYRASGGGDHLIKGAGISKDELGSRVISHSGDIRTMIYDFIKEHKTITPELVSDSQVLGDWKFIPESLVKPLMEADCALIF